MKNNDSKFNQKPVPLIDGELSALLGVSKQRINNIKRSINRKLFKSDGAATLNDNILSLCQM